MTLAQATRAVRLLKAMTPKDMEAVWAWVLQYDAMCVSHGMKRAKSITPKVVAS